jgi:membrane-associated PAP2 superfamily phosphatase
VILDMKTPNYNLKKFQKIFVVFSNQITNVNRTLLNPRLTGDWLITNITYSLVGRKFRQKVELSSRVLKKSPDEIENG